jgi:hypothetical protein
MVGSEAVRAATFCRYEVAMVITMVTSLLMGAASLGLGVYTYQTSRWKTRGRWSGWSNWSSWGWRDWQHS